MKRTPMKRKRKGVTPKELRELIARLRHEFHRAVTVGPCVMCANEQMSAEIKRDFAEDLARREAHHVLPKQDLKKERGITELDPRMWDPDDGVCLCRYHHPRHEHCVQRLPRRLVPPAAVKFAAALELVWLLDREYPPEGGESCDRCGRGDVKWCGLGWYCADCEHEMRGFDAAA